MTVIDERYPHVPAAFINAIREEGSKDEACNFLQLQWNQTCALSAEVERLQAALATARDDALEEAAETVEGLWAYRTCQEVADAIREMKGKP